MILFVGDEGKGFFLEDIAAETGNQIKYTGFLPHISEAKAVMAESNYDYIVIDITQFIDTAVDISGELKSVYTTIAVPIIIFAPGFQTNSEILYALSSAGMTRFITGVTPAMQRGQFKSCLQSNQPEPQQIENAAPITPAQETDLPQSRRYKTISLCGACRRIGTTTQAVQIIKYLQFNGYKAAYIEMNNNGFVVDLAKIYEDIIYENKGVERITYKNVDFYFKQEQLSDILKRDYDFFVFDYGSADDPYFNAISFIEKDIPIIVCGTAPNEWAATNAVIGKTLLNDAYYIFSFCDVSEHAEIMELMQQKAKKTIFPGYAPDFSQYRADRNNLYRQIIKVENLSVSKPVKKGLFGRRKRRGV